jgi:hypothetical protein
MVTRHVVTKSDRHSATRSAFDAQPIPRLKGQNARQERLMSLTDAKIAVLWLNAAKTSNATVPYERVTKIRYQLDEFGKARAELEAYGPDPEAWAAAYRELKEQHRPMRKGNRARAVHFPGGRKDPNCPEFEKLYVEMERLHSALNRALYRYTFRPRLTYLVAYATWSGGMVPDNKKGSFQIEIDRETTISEADAVLSLARLDLTGEIQKVRLCEQCSQQWFVARKNFHFCSGNGCREASYAKDPKYLRRKALNQKAYRKRMKSSRAYS